MPCGSRMWDSATSGGSLHQRQLGNAKLCRGEAVLSVLDGAAVLGGPTECLHIYQVLSIASFSASRDRQVDRAQEPCRVHSTCYDKRSLDDGYMNSHRLPSVCLLQRKGLPTRHRQALHASAGLPFPLRGPVAVTNKVLRC